MASTTGLVQNIKFNYDLAVVWVSIGPTATNIQLFYLNFHKENTGSFGNNQREAAFLKLMVEQLVSGMLAQREVTVYHEENDSAIASVEMSVAGGLMPS